MFFPPAVEELGVGPEANHIREEKKDFPYCLTKDCKLGRKSPTAQIDFLLVCYTNVIGGAEPFILNSFFSFQAGFIFLFFYGGHPGAVVRSVTSWKEYAKFKLEYIFHSNFSTRVEKNAG